MEWYINKNGYSILKETNIHCKGVNNLLYLFSNKYKTLDREDVYQEIILFVLEFFNENNITINEQIDNNIKRRLHNRLSKKLQEKLNKDTTYAHIIQIDGKLERLFIKPMFISSDLRLSNEDENYKIIDKIAEEDRDYFYLYKLSYLRSYLTKKNNSFLNDYLHLSDKELSEKYSEKEIKQNFNYIKRVLSKKDEIIRKNNYTIRYRQLLKQKRKVENFLFKYTNDFKELENFIFNDTNEILQKNINLEAFDYLDELYKFLHFVDSYPNKYNNNIKKDLTINEQIRKIKQENPNKKVFNVNSNGIII